MKVFLTILITFGSLLGMFSCFTEDPVVPPPFPEGDLLAEEAQERLQSKEIEESIVLFTESIEENADFPLSRNNYLYRGIAYISHGEYELALNDFDKAMNVSPNDPYVLAQRGRLLLTYMEEHQLAIDDLTEAISLSSRIDEESREKVLSNIHRELADAYFIYGRTLYEQGQGADMLQKALDEYSSVIELDSVNSLSHGQRGFIRWTYFSDDSNDEGAVNESLEDATKAIDYLEQDITAVEWPGNEVPENMIIQMRRWFALRALIHQGLGNDEEYKRDISVVEQLNEMIP